ncbi:TetR family transcriptional regulator C-terminal domain-containing protein [Bordetella genomosp. 9]|uniref:TetR/AcrR family transcriptional regulator n=1 Tax=Bordetella genomosp. 9 TaxID=1416803 RepID=UPI001E4909E1|nr:TetR family transcriptional regulator C-terminal domain-containing protein [Bordetella genomosp. 9]
MNPQSKPRSGRGKAAPMEAAAPQGDRPAAAASAPPDGRRLRGERSRAKVLDRSTALASVEGLEGLTFGRVAAEAGVGKANIQVLFGDREGLQLATLESALAIYQREILEPAMRRRTPLARLRALVEGWFAFVRERRLPGGCFITAASSEFRARPGAIRDRINASRLAKRERFRTLIEAAREAGELRGDVDADQLAFDLVACEAAANVAALMDDEWEFEMARRTALRHIAQARA